MKQFIVLMAVLPILLVFMLQIGVDQIHAQKVHRVQDIVYTAREEARQTGCFTDELLERMRTELAEAAGVDTGEIGITADGEDRVKYRYGSDRLIYYSVRVPIYPVMAGAGFFHNRREEENMYWYVIDSYTVSEKL